MTTLMRGGADTIAPVSWTSSECGAPATPQSDPVLVALEREVADLNAALAEAQEETSRLIAEARAEGRKDAEADFAHDETKRLTMLEAGIEQAVGFAHDKANELESVALLLCETALENIFERSADFRDLIDRAIARQLSSLSREMVLAVHVSPADFDGAALLSLRDRLSSVEVSCNDALAAGECRIDLRLGHVDLSLPRYWQELKSKLHDAAEAAP